jgi:serine/threonine protein kinase
MVWQAVAPELLAKYWTLQSVEMLSKGIVHNLSYFEGMWEHMTKRRTVYPTLECVPKYSSDHYFAPQFFGEEALVSVDARSCCTAVAQTAVRVYSLSHEALLAGFDDVDWEAEDTTREMALEQVMTSLRSMQHQRTSLAYFPSETRRKDLRFVRVVEQDSFGTAYLVRNVVSGKAFALKRMSIAKIDELDQDTHVRRDRKALEMFSRASFPFVPTLHQVYRTASTVDVLTDAILGPSLHSRLHEGLPMPMDNARFYAAQIAITLHFAHRSGVLHRDLKPENLMLTKRGFLRVVNWGSSKQLQGPEDRTHTFCGTPIYAAPELYAKVGHSKGVDYWSLGIVIHELITGRPPFVNLSVLDMHQELARFARHYPRVRFPERLQADSRARHLVVGLLHPQPRKRLGGRCRGSRELLCHAFFESVNWEELLCESDRARPHTVWQPDVKLGQYHVEDVSSSELPFMDADAPGAITNKEHWSTEFERRIVVNRPAISILDDF